LPNRLSCSNSKSSAHQPQTRVTGLRPSASRLAVLGATFAAVAFASSLASAKPLVTLDDAFRQVSQQAPMFAGAYYDEKGNLTLNVATSSKEPNSKERTVVLDAFVRVFGKEMLQPRPSSRRPNQRSYDVLFRSVRYSFVELSTWYERTVRPMLRAEGVRFSDIDERNNQLLLGVSDKKVMLEVWKWLEASGLPTDAIALDDGRELLYQYSGSISGSVQNPAIAGIELGTEDGGRCTLGMNAEFPNWWWTSPGLITAGHCTGDWDFFGNSLTQPAGGAVVAMEFIKPPFVQSDDCEFAGCRYSDTVAALYNDGVPFEDDPSIIRTRDPNGNLNIDDDAQTFEVISASGWLLSGDEVQKVGVGRGWRDAAIGQTCVDFEAPDSTDGQRGFTCQFTAQSLTGTNVSCPGDSGGPVFFWHETLLPKALLAGFLWGGLRPSGVSSNCAPEYVFSPLSGVVADLGPMSIGDLPIDSWY